MVNVIQKKKGRSQISTPEMNENRRGKLPRFLYLLLLVMFFGVTGYVFTSSDFVTIKQLNVIGNTSLNSEKILERVLMKTDDRFLGIFRRDTIIFLPADQIKADLLNEFKEIAEVNVEKKFPDAVLISVRERRAILVWCADEDCFLVDEVGVPYATVQSSDMEALRQDRMTIFRDESGKRVDIGTQVVDRSIISFVLDIDEAIMLSLGIELKKDFSTPSSISGDIRVETQEGWKIILNKDLGVEKELSMLQVALKSNIQDKQKDLEYIDLRSENRVYYKLRGGASEGEGNVVIDSANHPQ